MASNSMFIITMDKETANKLEKCGLRLLSVANGTYTFENKMTTMQFSDIDMKKLAYTNVLTF